MTEPISSSGEQETEDLDAVADRLEAALVRIVQRLDAAAAPAVPLELLARLDGLIERVRRALAVDSPGNGAD